ncbi:MAG: PD40 domain-containing protein [Thermoleophilia bacterium]|nr:PD40 domain-containing protein [Thermoleophilia bacterium]
MLGARKALLLIVLLAVVIGALLGWSAVAHAYPIELISVADHPSQHDYRLEACISADGRYIAFCSAADGLVPGDGNGLSDVFVYDRLRRQTMLVSLTTGGSPGDLASESPSISADGRYVAFFSRATDLVPGDTNGRGDVFVRDMRAGTTTLVSVSLSGLSAEFESAEPSISGDGRYVAFVSSARDLVPGDEGGRNIYVRDLRSRTTTKVSLGTGGVPADGDSSSPSISTDGLFVAFTSTATNLIAGDTNDAEDVFLYNRLTRKTTRVSVASDGSQANDGGHEPSVMAGGLAVAFSSAADNLVPGDTNKEQDVFVRDLVTKKTTRVSVPRVGQADAWSEQPSLSPDGRCVAYCSWAGNLVRGDTNGTGDIFVYDRLFRTTTRVSLAASGAQSSEMSYQPSISTGGRHVVFSSSANLTGDGPQWAGGVFLRDCLWRTTSRVCTAASANGGDNESWSPSVSADGRYVGFLSFADNLVPDEGGGIFVRDRQPAMTSLVGPGWSDDGPSISADGRYAAFSSYSATLVPGDTNGVPDVFVHDRTTGTTVRVSVDSSGSQANGASGGACISPDGRYVAFQSYASNLVPGDTNGLADIFVHDRSTGATTRISVDSAGVQANGSSSGANICSDGRCVAFGSEASNLVSGDANGVADVFVRDLLTGVTTRVSVTSTGLEGNGESGGPSISDNGRYVAFTSWASNLVPGDTNEAGDVFVFDRETGAVVRASVATGGGQAETTWDGSAQSEYPAISGDGRYVAFRSYADTLVADDTNHVCDVFVRDLTAGVTLRASVTADGTEGNNHSGDPALSQDGRYVAFSSWASNLVAGDDNLQPDIFLVDLLGAF